MATYRYVTSDNHSTKYVHIGNPTLCGYVFVRPRVCTDLPNDRVVCPECVTKATGLGWVTANEAVALLQWKPESVRQPGPQRHGADRIVPMMIDGCSDSEIARKLTVSPRTVHRLVADAMRDAGARTRFQWGFLVGLAAC